MENENDYFERMIKEFYGDIPKVTVYTTPQCPRCKELKAYLERLNITYTEIDITDLEAMSELVMQNIYILSAPTLRIGNQFFLIGEVAVE